MNAPFTRFRAATALTALVTIAPLLAGCSDSLASQKAGEAGTGPRVVASFYPLQYVAERVAGDRARITGLTSPGVEPHDLELTVTQTVEIAEADIAFYEMGFQPAVDEAIAQSSPEHIVETTETVPLEEPGRSGDSHGDDHGDDHGGDDPHFWLDPTKLSQVAEAFTDELAKVAPDHAQEFRANLAGLQGDLEALDEDFEAGLANCTIDTVVVSHDAFGYLGARYHLDMHAIAGLSPDTEPSPTHLRELHDLIETDGITTVFSETLASPAMSESIAEDLGIQTGVLDPVEGLTDTSAGEDYLSLMRNNLAALREANGCP